MIWEPLGPIRIYGQTKARRAGPSPMSSLLGSKLQDLKALRGRCEERRLALHLQFASAVPEGGLGQPLGGDGALL